MSTEFTDIGAKDGISLVQHTCPVYRNVTYVSAGPSLPGEAYLVPGCGCRPEDDNEEDRP